MKEKLVKSTVCKTILIAILILYLSTISLINFSVVPSFYDGDMYCDYQYAMEVWEHKSIFPEGWVFGNQLNAVSTPVLAALIYGFSGNINVSMAAACTIMAVLVGISYYWMTKSVLKDTESNLLALVMLITVALYCGNAVQGNQGWTLLFTMCSYYAGYSIAAFLAFGCYIRGLSGSFKNQWLLLPLTCILAFGTGIQSIRQTAIMVCPLLAVAFLRMVVSFGKWKENRRTLWITAAVSISNILGLLYVRMREINQNQIFGPVEFTHLNGLKQAVMDCIWMIVDLFGADHSGVFFILLILGVICLVSLTLILKDTRKSGHAEVLALVLLIGSSVLVIVAIDVFTSMFVRPRYYFMFYPLIGLLVGYLHDQHGRWMKRCLLLGMLVFSCVAGLHGLSDVCRLAMDHKDEVSYKISTYLQENGYTTIYAVWDQGNDVAVASNGTLDVGFWHKEQVFDRVTYLCNLDVYETDPDQCVYFFESEEAAEEGIAVAESVGISMELLREYPENGVYIYTASANLMQIKY